LSAANKWKADAASADGEFATKYDNRLFTAPSRAQTVHRPVVSRDEKSVWKTPGF